jgi:bile acid-coenzyme A ligase
VPAADHTSAAEAYHRLADLEPNSPAIVFEGEVITRSQLERRTNRLARAYRELGVEPDSLVTLGLPNGLGFIEAALATWKAGATPQPVSWRLPQIEREKLLELAAPALTVGFDPAEIDGPAVGADFEADAGLSEEPLDLPAPSSWKAPTSGGSTGRPKLIRDRRPATVGTLAWMAYLFSIEPADIALTTGPLYHNAVFSSTMAALISGARVVLMRRFDAATALQLVEREQVTWMYAVPTMMQRIVRLPEPELTAVDLSSLGTVHHTGAPCPPWLKRSWIDMLGPEKIVEIYAATEAQAATWIDGHEWLSHEGSVGKAVVGEIKIVRPDGNPAEAGEVGEVWMRPGEGRRPPYEYVGSDVRERDGWETLGDLGSLDDDGYLYLADREADMILVGGANVFPAEIEAALDAHPAVLSSCAIGLPHEDLGNVVHALIQLKDPVEDAELLAFLEDRLVRYKLPRSFERVDFPLRDDAGKVRRGALRDERLPGRAAARPS